MKQNFSIWNLHFQNQYVKFTLSIPLYINTLISELYSYLHKTVCDTTFAFDGLEKLTTADLVSKLAEANSQAELFTKPGMTKKSVK